MDTPSPAPGELGEPGELTALGALADAELVLRVRSGNLEAYGELHARHVDAARRLARALDPVDQELCVAEAFARVLTRLEHGEGPDLAFRTFLLRSVIEVQARGPRSSRPSRPSEPDRAPGAQAAPAVVAAAFDTLPEPSRLVLWHLHVEQSTPEEIARLLGLSVGVVPALGAHGRDGLRHGYLDQRRDRAVDEACTSVHAVLVAYLRGSCSEEATVQVETHLGRCRRCSSLAAELTDLDVGLRLLLATAVLGVHADAYVGNVIAGASSGAGRLSTLRGPGGHRLRTPTSAGAAGLAAAMILVGALVNATVLAPSADGPLRADLPLTPEQRAGATVGPPPLLRSGTLVPAGGSLRATELSAQRSLAPAVVVLPTLVRKGSARPDRRGDKSGNRPGGRSLGDLRPPVPLDPFTGSTLVPPPTGTISRPTFPPPPAVALSGRGSHQRDLGPVNASVSAQVDVRLDDRLSDLGPPVQARVDVPGVLDFTIKRG